MNGSDGPLGKLPNMRWCGESNRYYTTINPHLVCHEGNNPSHQDDNYEAPISQVQSSPVDQVILDTLPRLSRKRERIQSIECSICFRNTAHSKTDPRMRFVTLPCGHPFHLYCIEQWLSKRNGSCPNCREPVDTSLATAARSVPLVRKPWVCENCCN
jgi:hypothetical protein